MAVDKIRQIEPDHKKRAEILFREAGEANEKGQIKFDPHILCEALGEAEIAQDKDLMAEIYTIFGMQWGKPYPALSLSIWNKAEDLWIESNNTPKLFALHINMALAYYLTGDKFSAANKDAAELFIHKAKVLFNELDVKDCVDESQEAIYYQNGGTIFRDSNMLQKARAFYEKENLIDSVIAIVDEEIRIALENTNKAEAIELMRLHQQYSEAVGDTEFVNVIETRISNIDTLKPGPRYIIKDNNNIFQVLDIISFREEMVIFTKDYETNKKYYQTDKCNIFFQSDNKLKLIPEFRGIANLYRGQSQIYRPCVPSLFRDDMNPYNTFEEHLKYSEFCILLHKMPEYQWWEQGFIILNRSTGQEERRGLSIDDKALAQHYGIKTNLLDITNDKWVAAFFACTKYNPEDDSYSLYDGDNTEGALYCINLSVDKKYLLRIKPIGAQPFARPTEQGAFMFDSKIGEDFTQQCSEEVKFNHHKDAEILLVELANRANRLFPREVLQEKTWKIVRNASKQYSKEALDNTIRDFYPNASKETISKLIYESGVKICDGPVYSLSQDDLDIQVARKKEFDKSMINLLKKIQL